MTTKSEHVDQTCDNWRDSYRQVNKRRYNFLAAKSKLRYTPRGGKPKERNKTSAGNGGIRRTGAEFYRSDERTGSFRPGTPAPRPILEKQCWLERFLYPGKSNERTTGHRAKGEPSQSKIIVALLVKRQSDKATKRKGDKAVKHYFDIIWSPAKKHSKKMELSR